MSPALEKIIAVGLPQKYRDAIVRAMDSCAVKKHLLLPPEFEIAAL
jgi:hypothetical protein